MAVEINKDNSISIGFGEGIGQSVLSPFSDMMGVNIDDNPGSVSANFKFFPVIETTPSFTVIFDGDYISISQNDSRYRGGYIGRAVVFSSTQTLPSGLTPGTVYYISSSGSPTPSRFRVSTTLKEAITGTGYVTVGPSTLGVHTISFVAPSDITGYTKNGQGKLFALDSNQRVWFAYSDGVNDPWYLLAGNTGEGSGDGNGIIYYKGYILVWTASAVDALLDLNSPTETITWTKAFDGINISNSMANGGKGAVPFLSVNDGSVYFSNGSAGGYYQIGMVEEVAGKTFNPTDATTFTFIADVTTLPFENSLGFATAIKEINEFLVIGTYSNKVFFWDKKSPSFTSFLELQESRVSSIETIDNKAYVFMADSGSIYVCNTASSNLFLKVPEQLSDQYYLYNAGIDNFKVNASCVYNRELLFSITIANATTARNYLMSYDIDSKKLVKKNISSYGESGDRNGTAYGKIHYIIPFSKNIIISSSYYVDLTSTTSYAVESLLYVASTESGNASYYVYDNYEPNIITGLISYGDVYNKKTTRELFVSFLRLLATGQGVRVSYRRDDNSAWTLMKTIDYATYGAIKEIKIPAPITDIIDLQIKIELDGVNLTSPRLKSVRLIP